MINYIYAPIKIMKLSHYVENSANLTYSTDGAACFDICAALSEPYVLKAGERFGFPTAIKTAPEFPLWFRVNSRSGLALKQGIFAIGGIIDTDYRGEWKIILVNSGKEDYIVHPGDKIAQVELPFPYRAQFEEITEGEFSALQTNRGEGGFGSSGR